MNEWRTIDSAPRDGTWIIIWDGTSVHQASYSERWHGWFDTYGLYEDPWEGNKSHPTHWMPLPAPPDARARTK